MSYAKNRLLVYRQIIYYVNVYFEMYKCKSSIKISIFYKYQSDII